jgi:YggT family protein
MTEITISILQVIGTTLSLYYALLIIRILLTWFPGIDWSNGILSALTSITDPYLNIFRGIIPPIGGFDISSLLALILFQVIQGFIPELITFLLKQGNGFAY